MRILYVARHHQTMTTQDDEGAIAHALRVLGHSVVLADQDRSATTRLSGGFDLMLCHRLPSNSPWWMRSRGLCPMAVWFFDQVSSPDPGLVRRSTDRYDWATKVLDVADFMFCTDGDFVARNPKAILLRQGADERWWDAGFKPEGRSMAGQVLMTAGVTKTSPRKRFLLELRDHLGDRLVHHTRGLYGREFVRAVSTADLCVAPDSPSTDRYWSNRVYITLAAGGCLLHPDCKELHLEFSSGRHLVVYNPDDLRQLLDRLLDPNLNTIRESIKVEGRKHVYENHLYRHRLEQLLKRVTGETST